MINHSDRAHSPIGASSSERWFACPASVKLSEGLPNKTSKYAEEGTAAHEAGEYCIENEVSAKDIIGKVFNGYTVTEEMANAVHVYVDYIHSVLAEPGEKEFNIEQRFSLEHIDKDLFGTNDCSIFNFDTGDLHVIDYKHGAGKLVHAEENSQLMYYALGVIKDLPYLNDVYLTIVQPRREDDWGQTIRTWKTTAKRLAEFEEELTERVEAVKEASNSNNPESMAKAGEHCFFCKAKKTCKAYRDQACSAVPVAFSPVEELPQELLPAPKDLTMEQILAVMTNAKVISEWADSVQEYVREAMISGEKIEGYKLVRGKSNRRWKDEEEVKGELEILLGDDIYTKPKLKSPAQIEKLLGDKEYISKFTYKPEGAINVVQQSDKRPEIDVATIGFEPITNDD